MSICYCECVLHRSDHLPWHSCPTVYSPNQRYDTSITCSNCCVLLILLHINFSSPDCVLRQIVTVPLTWPSHLSSHYCVFCASTVYAEVGATTLRVEWNVSHVRACNYIAAVVHCCGSVAIVNAANMKSIIRHILLTLKYCSIVKNIVPSKLQSLPIPLGRSIRPPYVNDPNPKVYVYEERSCGGLRECLLFPFEVTFMALFMGLMIFYYGTLWSIIFAGYLVALLFHLVSCGYLFRFVEFQHCSCCLKYEYTADLGGTDGTGHPNGETGLQGLVNLLCICVGVGVVLRDGEVRSSVGGGGGDGGGGCGGDGGGGC